MTQADWFQLLARITPATPWNLDEDMPAPRGRCRADGCPIPPPGVAWPRHAAGGVIGVRVTKPVGDLAHAAAKLAFAAIERDVTPIILSRLPLSGFEQFGFRVERLPDAPEDAISAFEQELAAFWDLAIIINAEDVAHLG
jgi:hypothetical protein